jgi:hypothetical protein
VKTLLLTAVLLINAISYTVRADDAVGRFNWFRPPSSLARESSGSIEEKIVFKVDTVTGRTWWLPNAQNPKSGNIAEKWIEIEE